MEILNFLNFLIPGTKILVSVNIVVLIKSIMKEVKDMKLMLFPLYIIINQKIFLI